MGSCTGRRWPRVSRWRVTRERLWWPTHTLTCCGFKGGGRRWTPNQPEAEATLGRSITSLAELDRAGADLLAGSEAEAVLMTRGREGMALYTHDSAPLHLPAQPSSGVADPTGAGDTVAAVFTLAPRGRRELPRGRRPGEPRCRGGGRQGGHGNGVCWRAAGDCGSLGPARVTASHDYGRSGLTPYSPPAAHEDDPDGLTAMVPSPPSAEGDVDSCRRGDGDSRVRGNDGEGRRDDGTGADAGRGVCVAGGGRRGRVGGWC